MEKTILDHFNEICAIIGKDAEQLFSSPLFWAMVIVLISCLVLTHNGSNQNRLSSSLVNTFRQFGLFLLDAFNSVVQAFKSVFGFLDVLRLLFFGRLGNSTLYVLTNYAIIFLSIASFTTTMNGLRSLIGLFGILISFGIQSMELISTTGLIMNRVHSKGRLRETTSYVYKDKGDIETAEGNKEITDDISAAFDKKLNNADGEESTQKERRKERRKLESSPEWGRKRRALFGVALVISYAASVFFSYCYMFNAIVMPTIAFDDYMDTISKVNTVTEEFKDKLTSYRLDLVTELKKFNDDIAQECQLDQFGYSTLEANLEERYNRLDELNDAMLNLTTQMDQLQLDGADQDSTAYQQLLSRYTSSLDEQDTVNEAIRDLEEKKSSSSYAVYQAIQELERYYADPSYLNVSGNTEEHIRNMFYTVVTEGYIPHAEDVSASSEQIQVVFDNYTLLCKYYAEYHTTGLNLSGTGEEDESSVQALLEHRADVIAKYNEFLHSTSENVEEDSSDRPEKDTPQEERGDCEITNDRNQTDPDDFLNGESGKLLLAAMRALEQVPVLPAVERNGSSGLLQEPGIAEYLNELNKQYRTVSGLVPLQTRALTNFRWGRIAITLFTMLLALLLDGLIIILCFQRSRNYYENTIRNRRQLVSLLFIKPFTKDESEENEKGRRVILAGTVLGVFIYLLYFMLFPDRDSTRRVLAFVLILGGVLFIGLLHSLRNTVLGNKFPSSPPISGERFNDKVYELFNKHLYQGIFQKTCTVRQPKDGFKNRMNAHNEKELKAWRMIEDYKFRMFVPIQSDYEVLITFRGSDMEYYIPKKCVNRCNLALPFAILQSHGLAYNVEVPADQIPPMDEEAEKPPFQKEIAVGKSIPAYLLPSELMRLLYECLLLKTVMGNNWEYTMEDDLLDYERNDSDDEEN